MNESIAEFKVLAKRASNIEIEVGGIRILYDFEGKLIWSNDPCALYNAPEYYRLDRVEIKQALSEFKKEIEDAIEKARQDSIIPWGDYDDE